MTVRTCSCKLCVCQTEVRIIIIISFIASKISTDVIIIEGLSVLSRTRTLWPVLANAHVSATFTVSFKPVCSDNKLLNFFNPIIGPGLSHVVFTPHRLILWAWVTKYASQSWKGFNPKVFKISFSMLGLPIAVKLNFYSSLLVLDISIIEFQVFCKLFCRLVYRKLFRSLRAWTIFLSKFCLFGLEKKKKKFLKISAKKEWIFSKNSLCKKEIV